MSTNIYTGLNHIVLLTELRVKADIDVHKYIHRFESYSFTYSIKQFYHFCTAIENPCQCTEGVSYHPKYWYHILKNID